MNARAREFDERAASCHPFSRDLGRLLLLLAAAGGHLLLAGCQTAVFLPTATLYDARPCVEAADRKVWIAQVMVEDPTVQDRERVERELTQNLAAFVRQGRFFADVGMLPGEKDARDLVLRASFADYRVEKGTHPSYPLVYLTFFIYLFAGGPLTYHDAQFSAKLELDSAANEVVAEASGDAERSENWSFIHPEMPPDYMGDIVAARLRTDLLQRLLEQVVTKVRREAPGR